MLKGKEAQRCENGWGYGEGVVRQSAQTNSTPPPMLTLMGVLEDLELLSLAENSPAEGFGPRKL